MLYCNDQNKSKQILGENLAFSALEIKSEACQIFIKLNNNIDFN